MNTMTTKDQGKKICKHNWKPFGEKGISTYTEYTPSPEVKYIYHWWCSKCKETKTTSSEWGSIEYEN